MRNRLRILLTAALAAVSACSHRDADSKSPLIHTSADTFAKPLQSGDIRIEPPDGGVDLALIGDTISGGLSQKVLHDTKKDLDTAGSNATGFGADIAKMVKTTVSSALGTRVGFSINEIRGARYENGRIAFDWIGNPRNMFEHTKVKDKPALESFRPEDAQRFVDAVNARKRRR